MNKKEDLKMEQKYEGYKFNSVTQSVKVVNQNQTHNSRQEGMGRQGKRRDK